MSYRRALSKDKILESTTIPSPYDSIYDDKALRILGNAVLENLVRLIEEGHAVDFGLGRFYLKMRKNNTVINENAKSCSVVLRGTVSRDIQEKIIDTCLINEDLMKKFN